MKIKDYKCKCGCNDFFFADKGNQKGIYCTKCGKWLKWADKDEKNLIHCLYTDEEIAKSFIEDVEAVKDQLPCGQIMDFPKTFEDFARDYGFKDKQEIYTNGSELIPVFRVKQWLEHISTTKNNLGIEHHKQNIQAYVHDFGVSEEQAEKELAVKTNLGVDCISRAYLLDDSKYHTVFNDDTGNFEDVVYREYIEKAPSVTPQEPRWIPVSERLPKKDESVLLTICANSSLYGFNENFVKVMCGSYSPCEDKRDWIVNEIRYYIDNVIAWMPLPESYKESEER